MKPFKILASSFLIITLFASCSKQGQTEQSDSTQAATAALVKVGEGRGILRAVDTTGKSVTLDHSAISGIMGAMTMEYPVSDTALLHAANVGDSVTFTLEDHGQGKYLVTKITVIPKQSKL